MAKLDQLAEIHGVMHEIIKLAAEGLLDTTWTIEIMEVMLRLQGYHPSWTLTGKCARSAPDQRLEDERTKDENLIAEELAEIHRLMDERLST